jgi:hypothetical protein
VTATKTKTRIPRQELLAALEAVEPGLSASDILEQSSCVVFRGGWVYSFNDEICTRVRGPLPPDLQGACHGKPVLDSVRRIKADAVDVWVADGRLWVAAGRQRAYARLETEILLPVGLVEKPAGWVKLHPDLLPALTMAHEFAGKDDSQYIFTCVHLTPEFLEACDSTQALRVKVPTGVREPILVRREAVKAVSSLGVTHMSETPGWVHFRAPARTEEDDRSPELCLSCRRHLEEYDDLSANFAFKGNKARLPKELVEAADFAGAHTEQNSSDRLVDVWVKPGAVRVSGTGNTSGAEQWAKCQYDGDELRFRIAPKMLARIVERYPECEITFNKLKASGGNWVYVTALGVPNQGEDEGGEEEIQAEESEGEAVAADEG